MPNQKKDPDVTTMSIIQMPINTPKSQVFTYVRNDRDLTDAACQYADKLRDANVEIFERKANVLATEKGYFAVLFEEEIRQLPDGIDNPTPFMGADKRMKVKLKTPSGEWVVEDLANLVAKQFVPNLYVRKWVGFKDYNRANCSADNLVYLQTWKYWLLNFTKYKTIK